MKICVSKFQKDRVSGAFPGFPVGAAWTVFWGGFGPPMGAVFGENVCENKRLGSRKGGVHRKILYADPPMGAVIRGHRID